MWGSILKWAVKIAMFAAKHKEEVVAAVEAIAETKAKKKAAEANHGPTA